MIRAFSRSFFFPSSHRRISWGLQCVIRDRQDKNFGWLMNAGARATRKTSPTRVLEDKASGKYVSAGDSFYNFWGVSPGSR